MVQPDENNGSPFQFITFTAGNQNFCLEITQIREIRRWTQVTPLPHSPPDVLGVMNLRGAVIPIFDLASRLGIGKTEANERNVVIVAAAQNVTIGILVKSVSEILSIEKNRIQETPEVRSEGRKGCITGIIAIDEMMIRVVDLESVINWAPAPA